MRRRSQGTQKRAAVFKGRKICRFSICICIFCLYLGSAIDYTSNLSVLFVFCVRTIITSIHLQTLPTPTYTCMLCLRLPSWSGCGGRKEFNKSANNRKRGEKGTERLKELVYCMQTKQMNRNESNRINGEKRRVSGREGGGRSVRQQLGNLSAQEAAGYTVVKCITQYFHIATAVAASKLKLNFEYVCCATHTRCDTP